MAAAGVRSDGASTVVSEEDLISRSRDVKWYVKDLPEIPKEAREVFEQYSKIAPKKVQDHVYQVRERAWDVWPFPCLGGWRFLNFKLCAQPQYSEVLSRLQQGEKFLDLGCCFGQELRRLVFDEAPQSSLYGVELRSEFFDLGYELFLDKDRFQGKLITADIFVQPENLTTLYGQISIIYAGAFFHLFDWAGQLEVARIVTRLLMPEAGSMLLGGQVGSVQPGVYEHGTNPTTHRMFRHDEKTWRELWKTIGHETGTKWDVQVQLNDNFRSRGHILHQMADESLRELRFCVRRL